ncbi:MAG: LPS export ABC transporter periplasmic protein LptC [Spirochaetales bacterium]|nr:LPS export ABC transporter periplasmic protein LptC [Spirochaetales bacterium]
MNSIDWLKIRTGLSLCAALFPVLFCDSYRRVEEDLREKNASVRLKNFERTSYAAAGEKLWHIKAEETYIYQTDDAESLIIAYDFSFAQYEGQNEIGRLIAVRGEINYETRVITVTEKVEYRAPGQIFSGSSMDYNMDTSVLESKKPVTIQEKGLSTLCRGGIMVDRTQEREVCRNPAGVAVGSDSGAFEQLFR